MIEVKEFKKRFGALQAVDGVSFKVERGEVLGLLGTNGAGKTTTMRMIMGFIRPDSGSVLISGNDGSTPVSMAEDPCQAKAMIGYLPENAPLYPDMTVEGFLTYAARLRQVGKSAVEGVLERCSLQEVRHQRIETLSKGFAHRTALAQAMLSQPPNLILDEPTDGLDPVQKKDIQTVIRSLAQNTAIIISSHILEEIEAVCSRVVILRQGKIVIDAPIEKVRGHLLDYMR